MICQACQLNQTNTIEAPMCPECEADYLRLIRRTPETIDALQALAGKQVTIGVTERGGNRAFAPLPLNETALRLADSFKNWLQLADSDLSAVRGLKGPDHWQWHWQNLTVTPSEIACIPVAPQRYDHLKQLTSKACRLLTPRETLEFAGNCPHLRFGQPRHRRMPWMRQHHQRGRQPGNRTRPTHANAPHHHTRRSSTMDQRPNRHRREKKHHPQTNQTRNHARPPTRRRLLPIPDQRTHRHRQQQTRTHTAVGCHRTAL